MAGLRSAGPAGKAYCVPQDLLAGLKGAYC